MDVTRLLLAVEEAKEYLPGIPYVVTGNPVREEILYADRAKARAQLGVGERICILSFGGSLGAKRINEVNYMPNEMARNLSRQKSDYIGVILDFWLRYDQFHHFLP